MVIGGSGWAWCSCRLFRIGVAAFARRDGTASRVLQTSTRLGMSLGSPDSARLLRRRAGPGRHVAVYLHPPSVPRSSTWSCGRLVRGSVSVCRRAVPLGAPLYRFGRVGTRLGGRSALIVGPLPRTMVKRSHVVVRGVRNHRLVPVLHRRLAASGPSGTGGCPRHAPLVAGSVPMHRQAGEAGELAGRAMQGPGWLRAACGRGGGPRGGRQAGPSQVGCLGFSRRAFQEERGTRPVRSSNHLKGRCDTSCVTLPMR